MLFRSQQQQQQENEQSSTIPSGTDHSICNHSCHHVDDLDGMDDDEIATEVTDEHDDTKSSNSQSHPMDDDHDNDTPLRHHINSHQSRRYYNSCGRAHPFRSTNVTPPSNTVSSSHRVHEPIQYEYIHSSTTTLANDMGIEYDAATNDSSIHNKCTIASATTPIVQTPVSLYSYSISFFNIWYGRWTNRTVFQLHIPLYYYVLISMMDIVSNILSIYSFHYTTLTSTTLLGSISIPSAMFFARLLLRKVFTPIQYIGIIFCIIGGCYTIYIDSNTTSDSISDVHSNSTNATTVPSDNTSHENSPTQPGQQQYIGDIMAMTAAVLYGLGDCVAEYFIKYINRQEYLYMIGIFGMMFTMIIVPIFEYSAVKDLFTNAIVATTTEDYNSIVGNNSSTSTLDPIISIGLFIWFIASVTLFYMIEALFLIHYDATLLNLSIQSVNLWAYLIMYLINPDGVPSSSFFIALLFVFTGVCLYEMGVSEHQQHNAPNDTAVGENNKSEYRSGKRRRDSEVEIVHGTKEQPPVNYQSVQVVYR